MVEHKANAMVRQAISRDEHRHMPIAEARAMGAMALFGEKYGDDVRVIRYGDSVELCGGTHVPNTGNIGMIRVISESSIAAGIRRIEAITGEAVENALDEMSQTLREIGGMLNNAPDVVNALRRAVTENSELHKQVDEYFQEKINNMSVQLLEKAQIVNGVKLVSLAGIRMPELVKGVAFAVRAASPENTVFVGSTADVGGKPLLTLLITDDLVKSRGLNASKIVREAAKKIQGGGGGQPGFAQAGGKNRDGLSEAFLQIKEAIG